MTGRHGGNQGGRPPVHGLSKHPLHWVWSETLARCHRTTHHAFADYGGRGISVCEEWRNDFLAFYRDMIGSYAPGLTLERKNNMLGYSKSNCEWVDRKKQARNRRNNRVIATPSGLMLLSEAAELSGMGVSTLKHRVDTGWPLDRIFEKPDKARRVL
jgi:hypothetical protein